MKQSLFSLASPIPFGPKLPGGYGMVKVICVETQYKPFPSIVHENAGLLRGCRSFLDIGAGTGRFVKYFLLGEYRSKGKITKLPVPLDIEEYIAVEPCDTSCNKLKTLGDPRLRIVCDYWESVRSTYLKRKFDVVIFWDVAMFMDLRNIHGTSSPVEAIIRELDLLVDSTDKYFLFSLHPVKSAVIPSKDFKKIYDYLDNHAKLRLVAKKYLNRFYEKK